MNPVWEEVCDEFQSAETMQTGPATVHKRSSSSASLHTDPIQERLSTETVQTGPSTVHHRSSSSASTDSSHLGVLLPAFGLSPLPEDQTGVFSGGTAERRRSRWSVWKQLAGSSSEQASQASSPPPSPGALPCMLSPRLHQKLLESEPVVGSDSQERRIPALKEDRIGLRTQTVRPQADDVCGAADSKADALVTDSSGNEVPASIASAPDVSLGRHAPVVHL